MIDQLNIQNREKDKKKEIAPGVQQSNALCPVTFSSQTSAGSLTKSVY